MMDSPDDLDRRLAAPLPDVADGGFSQQVEARILGREALLAAVDWGTAIAACALLVLFVPARGLFRPIEIVTVEFATSLPFAVACAALALSQMAARLLAD